MQNQELLARRLKRVNDAIALREPDQVANVLMTAGTPYFVSNDGTTQRDAQYNQQKAADAIIKFYENYSPDAFMNMLGYGKANEIAGSTMIDWPGRPGTKLQDFSLHQVIERELMHADEYPELLRDFTGFMLRKYIPRAFPPLAGTASLNFIPSNVQGITGLPGLYADPLLEAMDKLKDINAEVKKVQSVTGGMMQKLMAMGFPPLVTGAGEAPFDIISDFFRGTMGMFFDQVERPDMIAAAANMFADIQIENFQQMKDAPMPVKRVFFPLHKGMDGLMSDAQYRELYWEPFKRIINALVDIGVTPYIYTEGPYSSRVECLKEVPAGKCLIHFEEGDFKWLKEQFNGIACICGGMSLYLLEWGKKQDVIDRVKYLIDNCASGGGYAFDAGASVENVKRENLDAMFETLETYGKK